jgi:hypothetical protein
MNFAKLLATKQNSNGKPLAESVDVFTMVDGKPSNAAICDDMLDNELPSKEAIAYLQQSAVDMGFTKEQSEKFWC